MQRSSDERESRTGRGRRAWETPQLHPIGVAEGVAALLGSGQSDATHCETGFVTVFGCLLGELLDRRMVVVG